MRVIIWGLGIQYQNSRNKIKELEARDAFHVIGVTSTTPPKEESVDGYPFLACREITDASADGIIVMSDKYYEEIVEEIKKQEISDTKIFRRAVLEIPNLNLERYQKLRLSRISIISNNCWGGIVCHALQLECHSPFKNMFVKDQDYLKLVGNLSYYLAQKPVYDHDDVDLHSEDTYPVLRLGDIYLHCNHDHSYEEAITKWNRRVKKVNPEHIFVEIYTEDESVINEFFSIPNGYTKAGFITDQVQCPQAITLYPEQGKELWELVNDMGQYKGNRIDLVELLLTGEEHRI